MLVDRFGRIHDYLRISLTDKCNLRCSYCMPYDLPNGFYANSTRMSAEEIFAIAKTFVKLGIMKIRITGGEPLVRKEFRKIIHLLSELPVELVLSTNGVLLDEFIEDIKGARISSVNVSLDSLRPDAFLSITKRDFQQRVMSNIGLLLKHDFNIKINTVAMKGVNDAEFVDFIRLTKDLPLHIRFIEYMPFMGNGWHKDKVITYDEILKIAKTKFEFEPLTNAPHSTSKDFRVKDYLGTFGIITTMSNPFCGDCNRLRLTADGKMKNCLFGKDEMDLLTALRNNDDIETLILESVENKHEVMGGQFDKEGYLKTCVSDIDNRSMIGIGG
ncbi:MAG: GTP 3',8-cyclase MoaA [Bacteroidetes bacterium]|nr:GTP 3',8-cyclase MoaA [Bacteroidota bacterium]